MTKMQSAGNGLKLKAAAAGGAVALRPRPDACAAGVDNHERTVRDSRSMPRAPPAQKRTAIETCCQRKGVRFRRPRLLEAARRRRTWTSLTDHAPVLPKRSIQTFVEP